MSKLQRISDLSEQAAREVVRTQQNWMAYLQTAARLYKYPFTDQLLIYAQRPDAAACASMDFWNKRMRRWVNRGAKGIALLDDSGARLRLKYVFDAADTHPAPGIPDPYLWQMQPAYEKPVMEAVANSIGDVSLESSDFGDFLFAAASIAVQDHLADYLNTYDEARAGTLLEEMDADTAKTLLGDAVTNSVAYSLMARCGLDADRCLHGEDFAAVCLHNGFAALLHLGTAVSDITRAVMSPIERTIKGIEQQRLFDLRGKFAKSAAPPYHEDTNREQNDERSAQHGNHLQPDERLSASEPDTAARADDAPRQIRQTAQDLPQGTPAGALQHPAADREARRVSHGDRSNRADAGRADDDASAGDESRAEQGSRSDGLGTAPERDQSTGRRRSADESDLQVNPESQAEDDPSAFALPSFEEQLEMIANEEPTEQLRLNLSETRGNVLPTVEDNVSQSNIAELAATFHEPDEPRAQNFRITDDHLGAGGAKSKFAANIAAIELLKRLETENREATPDEQDTLSRYVGWGGIPSAFDPNNAAWSNAHTQLRGLLTDEEYAIARGSVLNAHYTSPTVIKAMYQCIENMGFRTGNILEPSMGVGNFFGLLPERMAQSKLYGVELDSITGRIAQKLYPNARIEVTGFEQTHYPNDFFDLAVGNVPFGQYPVHDPKFDRHNFHIHDYFFAKTLDLVRPGGVVAFVTSRYTMDKQNSAVRRYLAQRAELLGAIRLPKTAFRENAGTDVTTDILFLQKRDLVGTSSISLAPPQAAERTHSAVPPLPTKSATLPKPYRDIEPDWVHLGKTEDGFAVNQYFVDHPEMVLGTLTMESRQYGNDDLTCAPIPGADLSEQLAAAISQIHAEIPVFEVSPEQEEHAADTLPADPTVRNFSYTLVGDRLYYRENSIMSPVETTVAGANRIRGMIEIRDTARALIDAQMANCSDAELHRLQAKLNRCYDSYTAKYDLLNSRGNSMAFSDDTSYPLLCSLEFLDEEGKLKRKADMFSKRTIRQSAPRDHAETAAEALAISIGERAAVDLQFMSGLLGDRPVEDITRELRGVIFENPQTGGWETADEYLSGNVRQKLSAAQYCAEKEPERWAANVEALQAAQPKDLTASEINVRLGARWIPPEDVTAFAHELFAAPIVYRRKIEVLYAAVSDTWYVKGKSADSSGNSRLNVTYGTKRINAYEILEQSLNLKSVRIFDTKLNADGNEVRVLNKQETILAQQKQQTIQNAFRDWIFKDPARRERLVRRYNDSFNAMRPRIYDGSHINFVGMNPEVKLWKHQQDAIARVLYGGNALLAHVVGAGKTYTMAAAAMESKRLGLCQKSMFVVPNHLIQQWAGEFLQLYPSAKLLMATKKDFETANRKRFCSRIATGDFDAVIIGHSQFEKIPISPERQAAQLQRQIGEIVAGISQVKAENGERFTIKQMEYTRKGLEAKLKRLEEAKQKDSVVTFEELGVDRLFVDEAHLYKNRAKRCRTRAV